MNEESVCNTCPYWARGDEDANGTCRRVPTTMAVIPAAAPNIPVQLPNTHKRVALQAVPLVVVTAADWWCAGHPGQAIVAEEDNEPTFTLRGQDLLAPAIVEAWARAAEGEGVSAEKVAGAREIAEAMMKWRPKKVPD